MTKNKIGPIIISIIATILAISILMVSGSTNSEQKANERDSINSIQYDEYDQNICPSDEYGCEEYGGNTIIGDQIR